jgi:hypothetical protein
MAADSAVERLGEIPREVETVGDLDGVGGAGPRPLGVRPAAVPGDKLHTGVGAQPRRECRRLAVRQHVDDSVPLKVHEQGAPSKARTPAVVRRSAASTGS